MRNWIVVVSLAALALAGSSARAGWEDDSYQGFWRTAAQKTLYLKWKEERRAALTAVLLELPPCGLYYDYRPDGTATCYHRLGRSVGPGERIPAPGFAQHGFVFKHFDWIGDGLVYAPNGTRVSSDDWNEAARRAAASRRR